MASMHKTMHINRNPADVWDAIRDYGAVHERLARDFVVDTTVEDGARVVTFANGFVAREVIVGIDEDQRRLAYSVADGAAGSTHHNASFQVFDAGDGSTRLVWITDVLPDAAAAPIGQMIEQGADAIVRTLSE